MSHAKLSPSSASRWLVCAGSVALPGGRDESSEFADEGTAAHTLASWCLLTGKNATEYPRSTIKVFDYDNLIVRREFAVTEDMASFVMVYVNAIRDRVVDDAQLFVEQKLNTGIESKRFGPITGTGDAIIVFPSKRRIEMHDLKFGRGVKVFAKDNAQLLLYGLGTEHDYGWLSEIDEVVVAIHQPRLDHYDEHVCSIADLQYFREAVALAVMQLDAGAKDEVPGDHCKFCPRKAVCKALERESNRFMDDFKDISDLTEYGIAQAMDKVELVELRCAAIRTEARRLLDSGTKVPGWCLEEGRQGNRKWAEEEWARRVMTAAGVEAYQPRKVISPADAEKKLAKKNPALWAALQQHIVRGAPTVNMVRDDGNRKPIASSVMDAFKEIA